MKIVKKVWGVETEIVNNEEYCMKFLDIDVGGCSSLHYHKRKDETFYVLRGICLVELGKFEYKGSMTLSPKLCGPGTAIRLMPYTVHRFWVPNDLSPGVDYTECRLIEVSTHHDDEDVFRLEESKRL